MHDSKRNIDAVVYLDPQKFVIITLSGGWLSAGREALRLCSSTKGMRVVNVLVTATQLIPAFAKLLLYRLSGFFPPQFVYSASHTPKLECFKTIVKKFRTSTDLPVEFVVIGDGLEEERASEALKMKFISVKKVSDLHNIDV